MNKEEIKKVIIGQSEAKRVVQFIQRDEGTQNEISSKDPFIRIITGVRRCGKSTIVEQVREQNNEKNYSVNFDDNRLTGFTANDFEKLYEAFYELFEPQKTWYFDEIQNIKGWELFVRRLHNEGHKVFITGSNARMLSSELGSDLTGRYIQSELFPFSFPEFLRFKNISPGKNFMYSTEKLISVKKAFSEYISDGGFPEYLQTKLPDYLKILYENIIYRDIVARHQIRNTQILLELSHFLISNISKETSYNALRANFGLANAITVKEYIGYLEDAYLLFPVNKFDYSLKKQLANPKKIYCIDTGLANMVSFAFSENAGRKLENIIFLHLRRKNTGIYYHRSNYECDFLLVNKGKVEKAVQVCRSLDEPETRKREMRGLLEAMQEYRLSQGYIITEDHEEIVKENGSAIHVVPAWKYLMTD